MQNKTFNDFLDEVAKAQFNRTFDELNHQRGVVPATIKGVINEAANLFADYCVEKAVQEIVAMYVPDGNPEQWLNKIQELNKPKP